MSEAAPVTVNYLELTGRPDKVRWPLPTRLALVREHGAVAATLGYTLYRAVGAPWHWTDRLSWSEATWRQRMDDPAVEFWVARVDGELAGYFELEFRGEAIDLSYFGLLPSFIGQNLGRSLLDAAVARCWESGAEKVTVNTCTLDHPSAMKTYLDRGFVLVRSELRASA